MDPTANIRDFLEACVDNDRDTALERLEDLQNWIKKGGFLPQVLSVKPGDQVVQGKTFRLIF